MEELNAMNSENNSAVNKDNIVRKNIKYGMT